MCNCNCKCNCTAVAAIGSAVVGIIAAFLQITGAITVTPVFLWVALGIAVVYLGVQVVTAALAKTPERSHCKCASLNALLVGILGTILFAAVLLAVGITATSVVSAILVGLVAFFFALTIAATACYVRNLTDCAN